MDLPEKIKQRLRQSEHDPEFTAPKAGKTFPSAEVRPFGLRFSHCQRGVNSEKIKVLETDLNVDRKG